MLTLKDGYILMNKDPSYLCCLWKNIFLFLIYDDSVLYSDFHQSLWKVSVSLGYSRAIFLNDSPCVVSVGKVFHAYCAWEITSLLSYREAVTFYHSRNEGFIFP